MPTPTKGPRLGGGPAHERLMLNNMATSLSKHGKITTTETRAKRLRPIAERLVTFAKRGDLASRRRVMQQILDKSVVHQLFAEIAPQVQDRQGGYTRIVKLGYRKELEAIEDPEERLAEYEKRVAQMYERGKAVNFATAFEIDEVIDPQATRQWILAGLKSAPPPAPRTGKKKPFVDTW